MGASGATAGGARGGATTGGGARGGIPLDFRRRETSRERLTLEWHFPVWKPTTPTRSSGRTSAVEARRVLPRSEAFSLAAAGDDRPLLILRECDRCKGSDDALLSQTMDNEKTVLLAHYFRCVKFPVHVLDDDHPFTQLFDERHPPHLFFATPDGEEITPLGGDQSQSDLWKHMQSWIDRYYDGSSRHMLREIQGVLAQYDNIDSQEDEVRQRLNREIEKRGPNSPRVVRLNRQLAEFDVERKKWMEKEKEIRASLTLKEPEEEPAEEPAEEAEPAEKPKAEPVGQGNSR